VINGGHWRPAESHDSHSARIDDKARHSQVTLCFSRGGCDLRTLGVRVLRVHQGQRRLRGQGVGRVV
jgi:hypothetical protein